MSASLLHFRTLLLDHLRRPVEDPTIRTEATPDFIRLVGTGNSQGENSVLWISTTDPQGMRSQVRAHKHFYTSQGKAFEWKYCALFSPESLKGILGEEGFAPQEREEWLLWHPGIPLPLNRSAFEIYELQMPQDMSEIVALQTRVWEKNFQWLTESLLREKAASPHSLRFFGAKDSKGQIISVGWIRLQGKVATLHGGSTLPEFRKQGAFTALVRRRLQLATAWGAEMVSVDASPRSLPILTNLGFIPLGETTPFSFPAG